MFRNTARPDAISQFKKYSKPSRWETIIATLSVDKAPAYFHQLLSFYNSAQNPALDKPLVAAFSKLLSRLYYPSSKGEQIPELSLSDLDLKKLTTLFFNSYICQEHIPVKMNTLFDFADKINRLRWAKHIYSEANKNNLSDIVTHSIAIKTFSKARDMRHVESAFAAAKDLRATPDQVCYLYGSMLEACYHNNALKRAKEVYLETDQRGYTNMIIWSTMIKIAGKLKDQKMAKKMLTQVWNDPAFDMKTHYRAFKHFDDYFPNQKPFSQAAFARVRKKMQKSALPKLSEATQWGSIIATLSVDEALTYFRQLLSLYNNAHNPALDSPLAFAFSALLSKISHCSAQKRIQELPLSDFDLRKLTTLLFNSYICQEPMPVKMNVLLDIAGKTDRLDWAKYIYSEARKNNLSNIVTHSIAIKIFGDAQDMQNVESAFATAQGLNASLKQTRYLYRTILQACYINNKLERAKEVYLEAALGGYATPVTWNIMIKIAGKLGDKEMAQNMLTLIMNDSACNESMRYTAFKYFNTYFPNQYESMPQAQACCINEKLSCAIALYHKAARSCTSANSTAIRKTMLRITDILGNQQMARDMLTLIMNDPAFDRNKHYAVFSCFNNYFPKAPIKAPEKVQKSAPPKLERFSLFHFPSFRLKALSGSDSEEKEHSPETTKTREVWQQLMKQPAPFSSL